MYRNGLLLLTGFLSASSAFARQSDLQKIQSYRQAGAHAILQEYFSLLSLPNVATDSMAIEKNAAFIMQMMKKRKIEKVQLLRPGGKGGPPAVYGEVNVPGATRTLVFYAHYDGQPVNPKTWAAGLHPFQPKLVNGDIKKNGRIIPFPAKNTKPDASWLIYARSASDDKAGVMAVLAAYDALADIGKKPSCNIKFFFEGEEEQGSPHLASILDRYRDLLQSDAWVICDGPVHSSGKKQVIFGVRGDTQLTLKIFGPKNPLHSGHYGNWVPNPVMMMAKLLASMKDDSGRVTVKGFYDDVVPLSEQEKTALAGLPEMDAALKKSIGFSEEEMKGQKLVEAIAWPSLNINGIESSNTGTIAGNIIPTAVTAVLDLRLVKGNDWQRQQQKVLDHIQEQGFYITEKEPTDDERSRYPKIVMITRETGYNAQRTDMRAPVVQKIVAAIKKAVDGELLLVPTLGGSLPLFLFEKHLKALPVVVCLTNPDSNQHAENENIMLQYLWEGIDMMAAVMLAEL